MSEEESLEVKNVTLKLALVALLNAPDRHSGYCAYPEGTCGGMGGICSEQIRHREAVANAYVVLNGK